MRHLLALLVILLSLSLGLPASAQERKLIMGSVYRIAKNLIEVKQEESGAVAVIRVDAATTYVDSSTDKPAKLKDITVGDQTVIKVVLKDGIDTAEQVKFVPALGNKKQLNPK
jgi:hypothetical protein